MAPPAKGDKLFTDMLIRKFAPDGGKVPGHILVSNPPVGKCKVINIYVDPADGKLKVIYDNTPV